MSWAARRRLLIIILILLVIGGAIFWNRSADLFKTPSCTDSIKNGDEVGVDCGGSMCSTMCTSQVKMPTVMWARAFPVTQDVYNAAAYVENTNASATRAIAYEFRLYDKDNILVARRTGVTTIPPLGRYAIVETGIQSGTASIAHTTFDFSSAPAVWERVPTAMKAFSVSTGAATLDTAGAFPKLSATVSNPSPSITLMNTVVAVVLFDDNENAINVSRTLVPALAAGKTAPIVFTWPRALSSPVVRYEILPIVDVFRAK